MNDNDRIDPLYVGRPPDLIAGYQQEIRDAFAAVLERAWTVGLSRDTVAQIVESKMRQEHFAARVIA